MSMSLSIIKLFNQVSDKTRMSVFVSCIQILIKSIFDIILHTFKCNKPSPSRDLKTAGVSIFNQTSSLSKSGDFIGIELRISKPQWACDCIYLVAVYILLILRQGSCRFPWLNIRNSLMCDDGWDNLDRVRVISQSVSQRSLKTALQCIL